MVTVEDEGKSEPEESGNVSGGLKTGCGQSMFYLTVKYLRILCTSVGCTCYHKDH